MKCGLRETRICSIQSGAARTDVMERPRSQRPPWTAAEPLALVATRAPPADAEPDPEALPFTCARPWTGLCAGSAKLRDRAKPLVCFWSSPAALDCDVAGPPVAFDRTRPAAGVLPEDTSPPTGPFTMFEVPLAAPLASSNVPQARPPPSPPLVI